MDAWNKAIDEIKEGLANSIYKNETAVSQSIVRRLIGLLGWDIDNPAIVYPEYNCGMNGRVDYALLDEDGRPKVLVEVKAVGLIDDGVTEQLVRYAYGTGVPIIILTDGKEWHFFYAVAGNVPMSERRFYKIDLSDRKSEDIYTEMQKYIGKEAVMQGKASISAEETYRNSSMKRKAKASLAPAFKQLVETEDDGLCKIISEKVADISGVSPEKVAVFDYLKNLISGTEAKPAVQNQNYQPIRKAQPILPQNFVNNQNLSQKSKQSSFGMLKIPAGSILTATFNPNLQFQTMDEKNNIKDLSDGVVMPISRMATRYLGGSKNGYEYFTFNGKKLSDIRLEFDPAYLNNHADKKNG